MLTNPPDQLNPPRKPPQDSAEAGDCLRCLAVVFRQHRSRSSCPGYPSPEPARSSRGTTNAVSWACCDVSPCQAPVNSSTAMAAVGNLNRTRSSAAASPARALASDSASSCMAGSCPTISRVRARGAISRARSNSSLAAAPYTRWSKLTLGEVSSSAAANCHVSRARLAVEQMTRSGARPAARSHRPATGASRRPRRANGRSWSATSGQADLACRSSTNRRATLLAMKQASQMRPHSARRNSVPLQPAAA